jgi:hypothetical protein
MAHIVVLWEGEGVMAWRSSLMGLRYIEKLRAPTSLRTFFAAADAKQSRSNLPQHGEGSTGSMHNVQGGKEKTCLK